LKLDFSIIIPVYNRPDELNELLDSLTRQTYSEKFEVIVVEDGSTLKSDAIVNDYAGQLDIKYHFKENSGAGASRNYGMKRAQGNYFVIFDSDCLIPSHYLTVVDKQLKKNFTDAYGGADKAHPSFSNLQKAINYSMTSFLTTGGIRGNKKSVNKFQPRSFNCGISKEAFQSTGGFSDMKIGEDIALTLSLWGKNYATQFIENAFVYHKRRTSLPQFYNQTLAFGKARPGLNRMFPGTARITYWFPSIFMIVFLSSIFLNFLGNGFMSLLFAIYFFALLVDAFIRNKNLPVAILSLVTTVVQFAGYGLGFLRGIMRM
jgi:glycosyltransferase involved in cell wall biosynthesis